MKFLLCMGCLLEYPLGIRNLYQLLTTNKKMKAKLSFIALVIATAFLPASAQYAKLFDFDSTNGSGPLGALISDGTYLFGVTSSGGKNNSGVIFKIKPDGTEFVKLLDFYPAIGYQPHGSLFFDGTYLYGMTSAGGTNYKGTIFKIKPDGTENIKLLDFADTTTGNNPQGSLITDGFYLYGMTSQGGARNMGTIFKIKTDGSEFVKLLDFTSATGGQPCGSLIYQDSFLYGMNWGTPSSKLGMVFKIKSDGTSFKKMLDFTLGLHGQRPQGSLISDGTFLYGMTWAGGEYHNGIIFKIKPDATGYSKLFDFSNENGSAPFGDLAFHGSSLFGMTSLGGASSKGVFFKIQPDGSNYATLINFNGPANGSSPQGSPLAFENALYGMTTQGGVNNYGTIFKYELSTGIRNLNAANRITVYPNPSDGKFAVDLSEEQSGSAEIEILNITGERVYQKSFSKPSCTVSLDVPAGIYFLYVRAEKGMSCQKVTVWR